MTPGLQTSEFKSSATVSLAGVAVAMGWISPQDASELVQIVDKILGALIVISSNVAYIFSRAKVKSPKVTVIRK